MVPGQERCLRAGTLLHRLCVVGRHEREGARRRRHAGQSATANDLRSDIIGKDAADRGLDERITQRPQRLVTADEAGGLDRRWRSQQDDELRGALRRAADGLCHRSGFPERFAFLLDEPVDIPAGTRQPGESLSDLIGRALGTQRLGVGADRVVAASDLFVNLRQVIADFRMLRKPP